MGKRRGDKTPWMIFREDADILGRLTMSRGRYLESKTARVLSKPLRGFWEMIFWWVWRVGVGINLGLILIALYYVVFG